MKTKKNNRGISSIIATLLLIVLTIVLIAVVWGVVNGLVKGKISQSSACFGNFEEVTLNDLYSCYDYTSKSLQFSLNVGDINLDGVLVSISNESQSKSFTLTDASQTISGLTNYGGSTQVKVPGKNSGATYVYAWGDSKPPISIQVAPLIGGQQCSASDSITGISNCALF